MKYWFYSEGNILGPYAPSELLALPAFGFDSLVCSEYATGDNPEDWKPAQSVPELAEAMSIGVGGIISSELSAVSRMASLETGFSFGVEGMYGFKSYEPDYSYGNILDTIDTVLGTYKTFEEAEPVVDKDYELLDRFEVQLSKIQEELEAAGWEKNILIEKIKLKDANEKKKSQEKILELEAQLKEALEKLQRQDIQLEQSKITGIVPEQFKEVTVPPQDKPQPTTPESIASTTDKSSETVQSKKLKSLGTVRLERIFKEEETEEPIQDKPQPTTPESIASTTDKSCETIQTKKLKSFGTVRLERIFKEEETEESVPQSPEVKTIETRPVVETPTEGPAPMICRGDDRGAGTRMDYSFTGVTPIQAKPKQIIQPARIETPQEKIIVEKPQAPDDFKFQTLKITSPPVSAPPSRLGVSEQTGSGVTHPPPPVPAGQCPLPSVQTQQIQQGPSAQATAQTGGITETQKVAPEQEKTIPDKTKKIPVTPSKPSEGKTTEVDYKERSIKNKIVFIATLTVFALIAIGGIGYFFLGGGVGFSEFSLLDFSTKKKSDEETTVQIQKPKTEGTQKTQPSSSSVSTPPVVHPPVSTKIPSESFSNENVQKAINIVKNYGLGGGRGTISNWFANSFLSTSGAELNEEWTATILHGNTYVVQYRLLRPRQDPLIYQFEVDIAKNLIVRGINNNAIELLDFPDKEKVIKKQTSLKPKPARHPTKPQKTKEEIPLLPLPDEPVAAETETEPTGFENITPDKNEKIKFILAQESDEDLF